MTDGKSRKIVKAYRWASSGKLAWLIVEDSKGYYLADFRGGAHLGPYPEYEDALAAVSFQAGAALQETMIFDDNSFAEFVAANRNSI